MNVNEKFDGGSAENLTGSIEDSANVSQVALESLDRDSVEDACSGLGNFSFALFKEQRQNSDEDQIVLSPLSAEIALSMLANATDGETLSQICKTIAGVQSSDGSEVDVLNAVNRKLITEYQELGGSTDSIIADSLWLDEYTDATDKYLSLCIQVYDAEVFREDLQTSEFVDGVNAWTNKNTRGFIPTVLNDIPDDSVVAALFNALTWILPGKSLSTRKIPTRTNSRIKTEVSKTSTS